MTAPTLDAMLAEIEAKYRANLPLTSGVVYGTQYGEGTLTVYPDETIPRLVAAIRWLMETRGAQENESRIAAILNGAAP